MRSIIFLLLVGSCLWLPAQNLQLHYDFGKAQNFDQTIERRYFTATFELFKPDKLGSTFLFVDVDFDKGAGGASLAYFEIARKITLHQKSGFGVQVEYNDGTPDFIVPAWLAGITFPIRLGGVSVYTSWLYRANRGSRSPDGQMTLVWSIHVWKNRFEFSGFVDVWTQDNVLDSGKQWVILSEPQLWYNLSTRFCLGSELEISRNFFTFDGSFEWMPTLALKFKP